MFKPRPKIKLSTKVRGLFSVSIPYQVNLSSGDWRPYEGQYENQKWGQYDSDSCWAIAMVRSVEIQLNQMWATLPQTHKDFLTQNGYASSDGIERMSERFIEILGGNKANGGTSPDAWQLAEDNGLIPRSLLTYSDTQASYCATEQAFIDDYFYTGDVTQTMKDLGKKFLTYFKIQHQQIGSTGITPALSVLQTAVKQAPLTLGIPVPNNISQWNNPVVYYNGENQPAHEVVGVNFPSSGHTQIADQYQPENKELVNCLLYFVHQGVITVSPIPVATPAQNAIIQGGIINAIKQFFVVLLAFYNSKN